LSGTRLSVVDVVSIAIQRESGDNNLSQEQIDACLIELLEETKLAFPVDAIDSSKLRRPRRN
jgi:hypothetical protein